MSGAKARVALGLVAVASTGCGLDWAPLYDEAVTAEALRTVAIAPLEEALTFARHGEPGAAHVLLVRRYEEGRVFGVDLSAALGSGAMDPIELFLAHGHQGIVDAAAEQDEVAVSAEALIIPVDLRSRHIAAGANFPEHADETGVEEGPFLFPKLVAPTGPYAPVGVHRGLLDYEVELGWVLLEPLAEGATPASMGLILCNDFTDRDLLLRHIDPGDVASGKGFTTGKSVEGYLPVGNLFVIPRDYRAFAAARELNLYVDHRLRQRLSMSRLVWGIDELLAQTWARRDVRWDHLGAQYPLYEGGVIEDRILIMSGTPPGVVFNAVGAENRATGVADFLFFGWGGSVPEHAIDDYITDARAAGIYLLPGDRVDIHVDAMGVLRNEVTP